MKKNIAKLKNMGFLRVGKWELEKNSLKYKLNKNANSKNILYAFAIMGNLCH